MTKMVYLILGSNLGNRKHILQTAITELAVHVGEVVGQSGLYETEPWGFETEDLFLNQVIVVRTRLTPESILEKSQQIEKKLGRTAKTSNQYASRTIDIDILFYENQIVNEKHLVIPHPRLHERRFTLWPLAEIAPELEHPVLKQKIHELFAKCTDNQKVVLIPDC